MGVKLASAEEKLDSEGRCIHSAEDVMSRVPTSDDTMIGCTREETDQHRPTATIRQGAAGIPTPTPTLDRQRDREKERQTDRKTPRQTDTHTQIVELLPEKEFHFEESSTSHTIGWMDTTAGNPPSSLPLPPSAMHVRANLDVTADGQVVMMRNAKAFPPPPKKNTSATPNLWFDALSLPLRVLQGADVWDHVDICWQLRNHIRGVCKRHGVRGCARGERHWSGR